MVNIPLVGDNHCPDLLKHMDPRLLILEYLVTLQTNQHDKIIIDLRRKTHIDGVDVVIVGQVSNENKFCPHKSDKRMLKLNVKRKKKTN
jgi:hypothetical protein